MRVAIAGAGIAGLTSAIALAQRGFSVDVFEKAARLEEIGAGIQLAPNATAILDRLGIMRELAGKVSEPAALSIRAARNASLLARIPLGETARARYGAPYCTVLRSDLQAALLTTVKEHPAITLTLAAEVREVQGGDAVIFTAGENTRLADVLIAADGAHSAIRSEVFRYSAPSSLGRSAWRAVVPKEMVAGHFSLDEVGLWLGPGGHLVHYPVSGGSGLNLVVVARGDTPGPPLAPFGAHARSVIEATSSWIFSPLMGVDPAPSYAQGRIALIGDAAHAMAPSTAQGGAQAIEDAWVLAKLLADTLGNPIRAPGAYANVRAARVNRVARASLRNLNVYEMSGVPAFLRNSVLKITPPMLLLSRLDWLFGPRLD
jgi:salicylate hydroxylase